jgi:hypothetical protein
VSEVETKRALAEHYKALANKADNPEQKAHYDREFEKAARAFNAALMKTRR